MDLNTREYEVDVNGQRMCVSAQSLGHALRKLGDLHWDGDETVIVRGMKPTEHRDLE